MTKRYEQLLILLIGMVLAVMPLTNALAAEESSAVALRRSTELIRSGDLDKAQSILEQLLKKYPQEPAIYNNLAAIALKEGDADSAELFLNKALQTDKRYQQVHDNIGYLLRYKAQLTYNHLLNEKKAPDTPDLVLLDGFVTPSAQGFDTVVKQSSNTSSPHPSSGGRSSNVATVAQLMKDWEGAWETGNVNQYLDFYSQHFTSQKFKSVSAFRINRKRLVSRDRHIQLTISNLSYKQLSGDRVRVRFRQRYYSKPFAGNMIKVMIWRKEGGTWRIISETGR